MCCAERPPAPRSPFRLLDRHAEALLTQALALAEKGDAPVLWILLGHILPRRQELPPITGPLPMGTVEELAQAWAVLVARAEAKAAAAAQAAIETESRAGAAAGAKSLAAARAKGRQEADAGARAEALAKRQAETLTKALASARAQVEAGAAARKSAEARAQLREAADAKALAVAQGQVEATSAARERAETTSSPATVATRCWPSIGSGAPFRRRTYRPRHEATAAVRADVQQHVADAVCAEGALVRADPCLRGRGWQVAIAAFAVRPEFEGHGRSPQFDDDRLAR